MHSAKIPSTLIFLAVLSLSISSAFAQVNKYRWLQTHQWSGSGNMETEFFSLYGNKSRVAFTPTGPGPFTILFIDTQHGTQQTVADQAEGFVINGRVNINGSTNAGYFIIRAPRNSWTVSIEQRLDPIDEWRFRQDQKKPIKVSKLGTWSGDNGQTDISVTVPDGHWRLRFEQFQAGALAITVTNQAGTQVVATSTSLGGEHSAWIHGAGTFTISVLAVQTPWVINADKLLLE